MSDQGGTRPDHGGVIRPWAVVAGGFITLFCSAGVWHSFGIFFKPLLAEFGLGRTAVSLVSSAAIVVIALTQLAIGWAMGKFGASRVIRTGIALMGLGLFLSGFAPGVAFLYLTFSLVMAAGYGFSSLVSVSNVIAPWFDRRRGAAIGIAFAGLSAGGLILTPFIQFLILEWSWRAAFRILGAGMFVAVVPLLWALLRDRTGDCGGGEAPETDPPGASINVPVRQALRTAPFWLLSGTYFACGFTDFLLFFHFPLFAIGLGLADQTAANILGAAGGISLAGTVSLAWLSDRTGRTIPLAAIYAVRAAGFALLMMSRSAAPLYVFMVFYGFVLFASNPVTSAATRDLYGPKSFGTLYGYLIFVHYLGAFSGPLTGGLVYEALGRYDEAFLIGAVLLAGAAACALGLRGRMAVR